MGLISKLLAFLRQLFGPPSTPETPPPEPPTPPPSDTVTPPTPPPEEAPQPPESTPPVDTEQPAFGDAADESDRDAATSGDPQPTAPEENGPEEVTPPPPPPPPEVVASPIPPDPAPLAVGDIPRKTIVPVLIYPLPPDTGLMGQTVQSNGGNYHVSPPWRVDHRRVSQAIETAQAWLNDVLGEPIPWNRLSVVQSPHPLEEWRSRKIELFEETVRNQGWRWNQDYIYLAFVRGMGGYAGTYGYGNDKPGYGMVGDACLEAICGYGPPHAGTVLLPTDRWPANVHAVPGQTSAFIHEVLHGLGLVHPAQWTGPGRPGDNQTIMGQWWLYPRFAGTAGLTPPEIARVREWFSA